MNAAAAAWLAPLIATVGGAAVIGGIRWLRAVTAAVGKLTVVAVQQQQTAETMAAVGVDVAALRRELHLHVRECRHADRPHRDPYAGPDRRRLPRPRVEQEGAPEGAPA